MMIEDREVIRLHDVLGAVPFFRELASDDGWGGRFLLCIDCGGARTGA